MEAKEYQIKTIFDIINCTNTDNLENFLIDFKTYLEMMHGLNAIAELSGEEFDLEKMQPNGFKWIDDGKNNFTLTLEAQEKN